MVTDPRPGQILTFYSYKGGTGRSMAVANFAAWLVKTFPDLTRGVLVMDWDLEAPGLHRYFAATAELSENKERPGVINYFDAIQKRLLNDSDLYQEIEDEETEQVLGKQFPLDDYLIRDVIPGVDFVKAGKYDAGYSELISTFNWVEFYQDFGAVFPAFRDLLLQSYDFCLIDSRTGFNDVSGICTMLLPEKLVTVFTPNQQNISGVLDLVGRATDYRISSVDPRTLSVFPLPSRIENAEQDLKETWQENYQRDFEAKFKSIYKLDTCDLTAYFDKVQLPHVSFYSYGEEIALLREERSGELSLSRAYDRFFQKLVGLKFAWDEKEEPVTVAPAEVEKVSDDSPGISFRRDSKIAARSPREREYAPEIYISYAHIDNEPLTLVDKGWVDTFQTVLQTRLVQLLGAEAKVWRDSKLKGDDYFSEMTSHRLASTDIFVAVISPRYVNSEHCMEELREFLRQAVHAQGIIVGGRSRIFKVVKTPVDFRDSSLKEINLLSNMLNYDFYEVRASGRVREFNPDLRTEDRQRFFERVDDLAHDIASLINNQLRQAEGKPLMESASSPHGVYLAETTSDLEFQRDSIKRELQQRGYLVLPNEILPSESHAFQMAVNDHLSRCRLSIHLVGDRYGRILEGDNRSVVEIQNELASERTSDSNFSRVIWMPIGLEPHDVREREFVDRLRFDAAAQKGADLIQAPLEQLKMVIQNKLTSTQAPAAIVELVRIYLICDYVDLEGARQIFNYLFDLGFEVILPPFEGEPSTHKEYLLLCDAVLIYYRHASLPWLYAKLTDLRKVTGWGRAKPMLAQAVLLAGPETEETMGFRTHEALVIRSFGGFDPDSLGLFVESIRQALDRKEETSRGK